jgi:hypothetical protein
VAGINTGKPDNPINATVFNKASRLVKQHVSLAVFEETFGSATERGALRDYHAAAGR